MKKTLCLLLAAVLAVPAFSQENNSLTIFGTEDGRFAMDIFSHVGWGYSFVKADDFTAKRSGELFVNILDLKVYPVESFGFELGGDLGVKYIGSRDYIFDQGSDHIIHAFNPSDIISGADRFRSSINILAINVPLLVKFKANKFSIGAGAEAQFNLTGTTAMTYRLKDRRIDETGYKGKVNSFTYGFVGAIGFSGISFFAKFYPKSVRVLPEGSADFNFWTLGVALGL